ncbi:MAG: arsenate reductase ArsC [Verrucomicrobiota bacterium]
MSDDNKFKMLFLCTGNSARSVMAEYLANRVGEGKIQAYSAGADPKGEVHPMTLKILKDFHKIDASDARSKSWDEFKGIDLDFVITVCDNAKESCPIWPGQPIVAHWGSPDPAAAEGDEEQVFQIFKDISLQIRRRIELFACLPFDKLDRFRLEEQTKSIGQNKDSEVTKS